MVDKVRVKNDFQYSYVLYFWSWQRKEFSSIGTITRAADHKRGKKEIKPRDPIPRNVLVLGSVRLPDQK